MVPAGAYTVSRGLSVLLSHDIPSFTQVRFRSARFSLFSKPPSLAGPEHKRTGNTARPPWPLASNLAVSPLARLWLSGSLIVPLRTQGIQIKLDYRLFLTSIERE